MGSPVLATSSTIAKWIPSTSVSETWLIFLTCPGGFHESEGTSCGGSIDGATAGGLWVLRALFLSRLIAPLGRVRAEEERSKPRSASNATSPSRFSSKTFSQYLGSFSSRRVGSPRHRRARFRSRLPRESPTVSSPSKPLSHSTMSASSGSSRASFANSITLRLLRANDPAFS